MHRKYILMPNPSEIERERMTAWVNDEQSAKIEHLEQQNRDIAKQFDHMLQEFGMMADTVKRVANVNIQLMRGLKELDERTKHLEVVEA